MNNIFYLKISNENTGLCNQIYSLVTSICYSIKNNINIIIISDFLKSIHTNNYTPISHVFNLNKLNVFLKKNKIILIDHNYINIQNIKIKYGMIHKYNDITDKIKFNSRKIIIKKDTNINLLCEDPLPNLKKKIFINFNLNDILFEFVYDEYAGYLLEDIVIDFENMNFKMMHDWSILKESSYNIFFKKFLQEIDYSDNINNIINNNINKLIINNNLVINVIHLRLEDDSINHWSVINNMDHAQFKSVLTKKYILEIEKHIEKKYLTIILTYNTNNDVINYLKLNNYNINFTDKNIDNEREINAIIDMSIGKLCNNTYIGPGNSTFTQCLTNMLRNKKNILFDLDNINNNSYIYNRN